MFADFIEGGYITQHKTDRWGNPAIPVSIGSAIRLKIVTGHEIFMKYSEIYFIVWLRSKLNKISHLIVDSFAP